MICIVLVNWNGYHDTLECLESLLRLNEGDFRIIVCDNGSSDGSLERIREWADGTFLVDRSGPAWAYIPATPRRNPVVQFIDRDQPLPSNPSLITVVRIGKNLGFAGANNIGCALALSDPKTTNVWYLNNDTIVHPAALNALLSRSNEDERIGMCGATLFYYHEPEVVQCVAAGYNLLTGRGHLIGWRQSRADLPTPERVEQTMSYLVGASILVSRTFLEVVGPISENYFLYFEELDWTFRNAGRFRLVWAPSAVVYHKEGATIGTRTGSRASPTSTYYMSVNLLRFVYTYRSAFVPIALIRLLSLVVRHSLRRDRENARAVALAIRDFLSGRRRRGKLT